MLRAFFLSIGQLGDPKIVAVFLKSLAVTLALLVAIGAALWYGALRGARWFGGGSGTADLAGLAAVLAWLAIAWLLFRVIAIGVMQIFADDVVVAVERRHYPEALAEARDVPLRRSIAMGLGSAGRVILVNLAVSPLYLLLFITGIGVPMLFFLVNGWLLGQDLGDMVAARHIPRRSMRRWRGATAFQRFALGLAGTALFLVPILNLVAPVLGAAMATHLFHGRRRI
ncbi:MAG: EI24 domain-containing protein [Pseudomonadota bacterium]